MLTSVYHLPSLYKKSEKEKKSWLCSELSWFLAAMSTEYHSCWFYGCQHGYLHAWIRKHISLKIWCLIFIQKDWHQCTYMPDLTSQWLFHQSPFWKAKAFQQKPLSTLGKGHCGSRHISQRPTCCFSIGGQTEESTGFGQIYFIFNMLARVQQWEKIVCVFCGCNYQPLKVEQRT